MLDFYSLFSRGLLLESFLSLQRTSAVVPNKASIEVLNWDRRATGSEAGVSMKAEKHQQKRKPSRAIAQSAASVLLFVICFVSVFQFYDVYPSAPMQHLVPSGHPAIGDRLYHTIISATHSLRLGTVSFRTVHFAANSVPDFPVPQPCSARQIALVPARLIISMLVSSGLEVRAPPQ
jgi:hypothetical protein